MAHQSELQKLQRRYEEKPSQWFAALAEEHRRAADVELALQIVRKGLENRSNYVSGHIVLARCLLDRGEDEEAQQELERVLELDSENVIALKVLSEIAERVGDPIGARGWVDRLLEVDPMNEEAKLMADRLGDVAAATSEPSSEPEAPPPEPEAPKAAEEESSSSQAEPAAPKAAEEESPPSPAEPAAPEAAQEESPPSPAEPEAPQAEPEASQEESPPSPLSPLPSPAEPEVLLEEAAPPPAEPEAPPAEPEAPQEESPPSPLSPLPSPAAEASAEVTGAEVVHYPPVKLSPEAGEGPPPADLVGAQVERPEPIELVGGPGMVVGQDQAEELVESAEKRVAPSTEEPEPVVTQTMAEVYLKQGLIGSALKVYRELLAQRPEDPELLSRIAELESGAPAPGDVPVDSEKPRYLASETGGVSARAFLAAVIAAGTPPTSDVPPPTSPGRGERGEGRGGVSFDEFFGGTAPKQETQETTEDTEPSEAKPDDDDFKDWLKGLKS